MKKAISEILWELIPHENQFVITEKDLLDYITNLQEELEEEKRINQEDLKYIDELNERIEKAVELLQDFDYLDKIDCFCESTKVLNILRGEDK